MAWEPYIRIISQPIDKSWGPTEEELHETQQAEFTANTVNDDELLDEGQWDEDGEDLTNAELLDSLPVDNNEL